jgi:hypothetical protein
VITTPTIVFVERIMKAKFALLIAITGFLLGCGGSVVLKSVVLENAWTDPGYTGQPKNNILVVGLAQRHQVRTGFEYHLVSEFESRGIGAIASVDGMPPDVQLDKEAFTKYFGNKGIDAVLITGLVSTDTSKAYTPGTSYSLPIQYFDTFHGYYVAVNAEHQNSEYWTDNIHFVLESNLYDVASEKLIWQGISEPVNPENVMETIVDLSWILVTRLGQDGLVALEMESEES